jgi:hypothetical protein
MTIYDVTSQWDLICDLWNQLELDDVLLRDWPIEKRWQLDLLFTRMRAMDQMFEEIDEDDDDDADGDVTAFMDRLKQAFALRRAHPEGIPAGPPSIEPGAA